MDDCQIPDFTKRLLQKELVCTVDILFCFHLNVQPIEDVLSVFM